MCGLRRVARTPLFWLTVLYVLTGVVYAVVVPVFEKPDEEYHYGYILYLREHRTIPPPLFVPGLSFEYKQPPLYYIVASVLTSWLPVGIDPERPLDTNPYVDFSVQGYRSDNRNVFLHPPHVTPLVLGSRLVSLLFGLGTMIVSYFLALQLFPKKPAIPTATAAVVGFQPKFLYLATAVNNDAAVAFFGALIVTLLMRRLQRGPKSHFAVLLGGLLGLASITKVSGLVFFPLAGLGLLFIHSGFRRSFFRDGVVIAVIALLVGGWWYARNALVYGDPLTIGTHLSDNAALRPLWSRLGHDVSSVEHTFWANPSRVFVGRIWLDEVLVWWGRTSLVLLALGALFNRRLVRANVLALTVLLSWPTTFLFLLIVYWNQKFSWPFGRLLFPAMAPIALSFVLGWYSAFPTSWRRLTVALGTGVVVVASVLIPFVSIYPLYHPWRKWAGEQAERPVDTVYTESDTGTQVAQLIGYDLSEPFATPGTYLPVELCWKPLAQTEVPYAVFIHLLDLSQLDAHDSPGVWGSRRTYPGLGNLPTDRWMPDEIFCDQILVYVSRETPTPLGATIEVGFIDPETDNRLQVTGAQGALAFVGSVPILSPEDLSTTRRPAHYILDSAIGLVQMQLSSVMEGAGDSVTLTLAWQSLQPVPYDATTFIHLRGADGNLLAQVDRQPLDGRFPTSYWLPGQVVTDVVSLSPVSDTYDEPLTLAVGMYTWPSLERLPVVDASGSPQRDNIIEFNVPSFPPAGQVTIP